MKIKTTGNNFKEAPEAATGRRKNGVQKRVARAPGFILRFLSE
jgi:hypothetical protein